MEMTKSEIINSYNRADDKEAQLEILADLNACDIAEIKNLLPIGDVDWENALKVLYGKLEDADAEIKSLEIQRKKIEKEIQAREAQYKLTNDAIKALSGLRECWKC